MTSPKRECVETFAVWDDDPYLWEVEREHPGAVAEDYAHFIKMPDSAEELERLVAERDAARKALRYEVKRADVADDERKAAESVATAWEDKAEALRVEVSTLQLRAEAAVQTIEERDESNARLRAALEEVLSACEDAIKHQSASSYTHRTIRECRAALRGEGAEPCEHDLLDVAKDGRRARCKACGKEFQWP